MQYEQPSSLPTPDARSAAHSDLVASHIRNRIAISDGEISFAEFMHEVLYARGLGYYSAGATKFGAAGDFVTAPEVSSVFGRVLARQCAEVLSALASGDVLEVGAGSGKLAVDVLTSLQASNALPRCYFILEVSADLRERQASRLQRDVPALFERVVWLAELPQQFEGVIIANEVVDALPVERFEYRRSGALQQCVTVRDNEFVWSVRPAPQALQMVVADIVSELPGGAGQRLVDGYVSDVSLAAPLWIADVAACLKKGVVFLFDYGVSRSEYYAPERAGGWLRCHFRHHAHNNPLILTGIQDVTAWVDFSALAAAAVNNDLDILGYQTQSQFLLGGGLEREMLAFEALSSRQQLELSGQVKTLTLPGEMGENFKCIALGRGDVVTPTAFDFADRTRTL